MAQGLKQQFIEWVGKQPAERSYVYDNTCGCAFAQFLRDCWGMENPSVGASFWAAGPYGDRLVRDLPAGINDAVYAEPRTFGALAERLAAAA